jgi:hypothetical protein
VILVNADVFAPRYKSQIPGSEEKMRGIRAGYVTIVLLIIGLNGFALLQHLGVVPELSGFIAATLLADMLTAPIIVWAAYVFGHIAEDRYQHRKHRHPA